MEVNTVGPAVAATLTKRIKEDFRLFPTLRGYRRRWLGRDLVAGVTFGAVTMPGQLATAHLAGMPPITGLYGFVVATIVAAAISTNRHLAMGVDSTVAPILAAGLAALGAVAESERYIGLALVTAFLVGIFTLTIGVGRLGWVGDFLSRPVMIGFFGGIAVIIIINQLPGVLGIPETHGRTISKIIQLIKHLPETNHASAILGFASLALLLGIARINRRIPGALIVLVLSTLSMFVFHLKDRGVTVLGPLDRGLPSIQLPPFSLDSIEAVGTTALVVGIFCLAQTAATTRSASNLGGFDTDINADFRALGIANIASSLVGSFTINASPPSTTIIAESRARSQLASLIASALAVVVLFFSQIIEDLPMATLSAVLIYIAIKIFRVDQMRATKHYSWKAFALMLISLIGTVLLGIVYGVLFAVLISFIYQASRTARPELLRLGRSPQGTWLTLTDERAAPVPGVAAFALNGPLWFGNASWFRMQLIDVLPETGESPDGEDVSDDEDQVDLLVLDARRIDDIDFTGFEALSDVAEVAALRDVPFLVVVQEGRTQKAFHQGGFSELLGRSRFFDTIPLAIAAYPNLRANRQNRPAGPDTDYEPKSGFDTGFDSVP
ncbi:MAG: SulP family inorganic anion transporter [Mycobacterium sp.]|nr:SulP family inorganic anion transporter [Mycobacterium sp.]